MTNRFDLRRERIEEPIFAAIEQTVAMPTHLHAVLKVSDVGVAWAVFIFDQ